VTSQESCGHNLHDRTSRDGRRDIRHRDGQGVGAAIKAALEAEGIEFTDDKGVLGVLLHPKKRRK
jgi:hypothetical protein